MAEATSAAPLWMIRKTTSRKPKNAATISDVEMTWLPVRPRFALKTAPVYDRGAESSISNRRSVGDNRGGAALAPISFNVWIFELLCTQRRS
jgi:hypothetical protein